ncbi:hypothetical protein WKV44_09515 [Spirochaetia bacterium 38H-sp]|uniref:Uncharacterized protein n=1 Tax=Rarispira pelagica TaxID=3141764 RepID=A0ABU9UFL1_9SPIR
MGDIDWKWVGISIIIFFIAQIIFSIAFSILGIMTLGIGFLLFLILKPVVYYAGGLITGYISPGITIKEPAIGAFIIAVLGIILDSRHFGIGRLILSALSGGLAFFLALVGASTGEKMQDIADDDY